MGVSLNYMYTSMSGNESCLHTLKHHKHCTHCCAQRTLAPFNSLHAYPSRCLWGSNFSKQALLHSPVCGGRHGRNGAGSTGHTAIATLFRGREAAAAECSLFLRLPLGVPVASLFSIPGYRVQQALLQVGASADCSICVTHSILHLVLTSELSLSLAIVMPFGD